MGFLIWKKSDVKIFLGVMIALVITILILTPPNLWGGLVGYFLETPPLLIFGQLGILIVCSFLLTLVLIIILRPLT